MPVLLIHDTITRDKEWWQRSRLSAWQSIFHGSTLILLPHAWAVLNAFATCRDGLDGVVIDTDVGDTSDMLKEMRGFRGAIVAMVRDPVFPKDLPKGDPARRQPIPEKLRERLKGVGYRDAAYRKHIPDLVIRLIPAAAPPPVRKNNWPRGRFRVLRGGV